MPQSQSPRNHCPFIASIRPAHNTTLLHITTQIAAVTVKMSPIKEGQFVCLIFCQLKAPSSFSSLCVNHTHISNFFSSFPITGDTENRAKTSVCASLLLMSDYPTCWLDDCQCQAVSQSVATTYSVLGHSLGQLREN